MSEPLFESPNLDDLSVDPADLDEAARVLRALSVYAEHKASAMRLRMSGDVRTATDTEAVCDYLYHRLPEWARW
jgi:hypothetical protein